MADITSLRAAIASEASALLAFLELLEQEKALLVKGHAEEILALSERKTPLVTRLSEAGQERDAALRDLGVAEPSRAAVDAFLVTQADPNLREAWHSLLELAHSVNQANRTNASLVSTRLQQNQQALGVLLSASGQDTSGTIYGPDGHRQQSAGGRPLGSA